MASDEPDLEAALDGLMTAVDYCEAQGYDDIAHRLARRYQDVALLAPREDWESVDEWDHDGVTERVPPWTTIDAVGESDGE